MILFFLSLVYAQPTTIPAQLLLAKEQSMSLGLPQRINLISESLLGVPYLLDPEGEEAGFDTDPRQNFEHMDCLTYVEAVLSFSMGETPQEILSIRNDIRYFEGNEHYEYRKHFMFSQWIPSNIELGYIQDISIQIGKTERFSRTFTEDLWKNWGGKKKIPLSHERFPMGMFELDVLPVEEAIRNIEKIPSGALLVVIRDSNKGNPVLISHIGFVIDKKVGSKTKKKMRHATIMGKPQGVKEHDLLWYLNHMKDYPYKWKVRGVSIFYPKYPTADWILLDTQTEKEEPDRVE